jgi:hypothetical protein
VQVIQVRTGGSSSMLSGQTATAGPIRHSPLLMDRSRRSQTFPDRLLAVT